MKSQDLEQFKLPDTPGVYFFREGEKILYIGKATSLRSRVRSYFAGDLIHTRGPGIVDMVFKSGKVTFEETDSVLEALILEANLIKKYKPHYNTKEKDDKSWNYVCITKEQFPKVIIERQKNINFELLQTTNYQLQTVFGPYTEGASLREALKIIRRIFPYIDPASAKRDNYEFYRQLGLAPDVTTAVAQVAYKKNINNIKRFFSGKKKEILRELEKDMKDAAKNEQFERAAQIRNQIFALTHINDVALLKRDLLPPLPCRQAGPTFHLQTGFRIEAYDVAHTSGQNTVGVMVVLENGEPNKKEYRTFTIRQPKGGSDTDALAELVGRRLRHVEWGLPDLVVTDGGEGQKRVAERILKGYQLEIPVVSVVKDSAHKPKDILGDKNMGATHKDAILLANSEAHRFSLRLHKAKRGKSFLGK